MLAMRLWENEKWNISQLNLTQPESFIAYIHSQLQQMCSDKIQLGLFVTKKQMA